MSLVMVFYWSCLDSEVDNEVALAIVISYLNDTIRTSTQVRLASESDPSSLYSLCRRWVRNDIPRADRVWILLSLYKEINHYSNCLRVKLAFMA